MDTKHMKEENKDCAFQYYTDRLIEDTGLITREEAERLWEKYEDHFIKQVVECNQAEMAIWINLDARMEYKETAKHVCSDDVVIRDGEAYLFVPAFPS